MAKEKAAAESKEKPNWLTMKPADIEKIIVDLHKEGNSTAKIGLILRDKYGVPKAKLLGKKIKKVILESKETVKSEKQEIEEKIKILETHIAKNKKDHSASRSLTKKLWILRKATH